MHFGKRRHTRIDVIPMDKEEAMDAPLFFRKAIMDAGERSSAPAWRGRSLVIRVLCV